MPILTFEQLIGPVAGEPADRHPTQEELEALADINALKQTIKRLNRERDYLDELEQLHEREEEECDDVLTRAAWQEERQKMARRWLINELQLQDVHEKLYGVIRMLLERRHEREMEARYPPPPYEHPPAYEDPPAYYGSD